VNIKRGKGAGTEVILPLTRTLRIAQQGKYEIVAECLSRLFGTKAKQKRNKKQNK